MECDAWFRFISAEQDRQTDTEDNCTEYRDGRRMEIRIRDTYSLFFMSGRKSEL
jgi:hypothetical protein